MKANTTPGPGPTLKQVLFLDIMGTMEMDFEYRDDLVGITAQKYGYHLYFYGRKEDDHKLVVGEFGRLVPADPARGIAKEWIEYHPTPGQIELMQHIVNAELRKLQEEDAHQAEIEARAQRDWLDWEETMESLYRTER